MRWLLVFARTYKINTVQWHMLLIGISHAVMTWGDWGHRGMVVTRVKKGVTGID